MNISDLQPGDVLLYSGRSWIGKLIRKLDGTEITHVGIFMGDGNVGEALMVDNPGINANPLAKSIDGSDWVAVKRLETASLDRDLILNIAHNYIAEGNRYAYAEVVLLAVILATRQVNLHNSLLGKIAYWSMRKANDWIEQMFDQGREPMICSEFVYRCFDEADPADDDPYSLDILSQGSGSGRRRFSRFRLKERVFGAQPETDLPTIHPDSLLADALKEPAKLAMAAAADDLPTESISDDELDDMIANYLDEPPQRDQSKRMKLSTAAAAPVSKEELEQMAAVFAVNLASEHRFALQAAPYAGASISSRLMAVVADFVTPGDLWKSPSLSTVGKLIP
jgi:hypothetical protein